MGLEKVALEPDKVRTNKVRVWAFLSGKVVDTAKVQKIDYLERNASVAADAVGEIAGMADAAGAEAFARRELRAQTGNVVVFIPVPDEGRPVTGMTFRPQVIVLDETKEEREARYSVLQREAN